MATTLPASPAEDDRLLELDDEAVVVDDVEDVVELLDVEDSDEDVDVGDVDGREVDEVVVSAGEVEEDAVEGGDTLDEVRVGEAVAVVRVTVVRGSGVLIDVAALLLALGPDSAGTVTGGRVAVGTAARVVATPPEVAAGAGSEEVTALPQAARSRAVMPCPATIRAVRRLREEDTHSTLTPQPWNPREGTRVSPGMAIDVRI